MYTDRPSRHTYLYAWQEIRTVLVQFVESPFDGKKILNALRVYRRARSVRVKRAHELDVHVTTENDVIDARDPIHNQEDN